MWRQRGPDLKHSRKQKEKYSSTDPEWNEALECHSHLSNIFDAMADGKTTVEKTMHVPLFGAKVAYELINTKDEARLHQFGATEDGLVICW